jgi:integrase
LRIAKRRLRDAGLPESTFTAHSFRATTATQLGREGVPREKVQYLLGHSSSPTTEMYDHSSEERAMEIVDQITL